MKKDYIVPKVGDVIEYIVETIDKEGPTISKVYDVNIQYDMFNNFMCLIEVDGRRKNKRSNVNVCYVTKIISTTNKVPAPLNIFFGDRISHGKYNYYGSPAVCVSNILSYVYQNIDRQINFERTCALYKKNGVGLENINGYFSAYYRIKNIKKFRKWVTKNITKILNTVEEQKELKILGQKEEEDFYDTKMDYIFSEYFEDQI